MDSLKLTVEQRSTMFLDRAVMVADDQDLLTVESVEDLVELDVLAEADIPKMIDEVLRLDTLVPPLDHHFIHVQPIRERSVTVLDDVGVVVMSVGGKEDSHEVNFMLNDGGSVFGSRLKPIDGKELSSRLLSTLST